MTMTMWHPTEDELIQHLCGEGGPAGRGRLDSHLTACEDCRRACEEITGALTIANAAVPEPPDGFERVMWARVQQALVMPQPIAWTWRQWLPTGTLAAAILAGVRLASAPAPATPTASAVDAHASEAAAASDALTRDRVLYTALDTHFQQAELLLIELRNAPERNGLDFERMTADELVSAGRLYRLTAAESGHPGLVRVLDDLEPVLVEVARSSDRIDTEDRDWLRARIDKDNLLFKVRVATNDIRERAGYPDQQ